MRLLIRILALILGLAITTAGAMVLAGVGWAMARPDEGALLPWPHWLDRAEELVWTASTVRVTAWVLVAAGLAMLLLAVLSGRHDVYLQDPAPDVTVTTSPRSLARIVGQRVRGTDGVRSASVTASARSVRVRATSRLLDERRLRPVLIEQVNELVNELPLARVPHVHVVVHSAKDRP
jgi:Family of unknown function (DUF6286)